MQVAGQAQDDCGSKVGTMDELKETLSFVPK